MLAPNCSLAGGCITPFIAKISDISSRQTALAIGLACYTLGYILTVATHTAGGFAAGRILSVVGNTALDFVAGLIIAG